MDANNLHFIGNNREFAGRPRASKMRPNFDHFISFLQAKVDLEWKISRCLGPDVLKKALMMDGKRIQG